MNNNLVNHVCTYLLIVHFTYSLHTHIYFDFVTTKITIITNKVLIYL